MQFRCRLRFTAIGVGTADLLKEHRFLSAANFSQQKIEQKIFPKYFCAPGHFAHSIFYLKPIKLYGNLHQTLPGHNKMVSEFRFA